jgi:acyl-CoA dehydrogenase
MNLQLSDEERLIKDTAAQFVARELIGREGVYLRQAESFLPPGDPPRRDLTPAVRDELIGRARQAGLWMLELPEPMGGSALGAVARVLIHREFGRSVLPFRPPSIPRFMYESDFGQRLADGTASLALAFDEAHKTGELSQLKTLYRQETDGCTLRDSSLSVSNARADLFLMPAREQGTQRLGLFAIEKDAPGVIVSDEVDLTTDATVARLTLRQCKIPNERLVGYEYEAGALIASEQLNMAARCIGIAMRCLDASIEHAKNRVTFGRRLAERQAIQWMLADLSIALRTCTWLTLEAAWRADQDLPYFDHAAVAKKRTVKMAFDAVDAAIQIHGGYGVCKEFPFEAFYRETRLMRLLFGRQEELDRTIGQKFLDTD